MFVAPSGGGKTSTALRCSHWYAGNLVSTDRTILLLGDEGNHVLGVGGPDPVRVGVGAAGALGLTDEEARTSVRAQPKRSLIYDARTAPDVKYELTLHDVQRFWGIQTAESALIGCLVLVERGAESLSPVVPKEAADLLFSEVLHPEPKDGFLLAEEILERPAALQRARHLVKTLPVYRMYWRPEDLSSLEALRRLIEETL